MIEGDIDANSVLQLNAQRETIAQQANAAIEQAPIPDAAKEAQKNQFAENQDEFRETVVETFTDSLHHVFYVSAGLMALALVSVSLIKERELRDGKDDAPGVAE